MRYLLQLHGHLPIEAYPRLAARAEELGFADVTVHDVLLRRPVWPVLCDIARATTSVQVGPNVTHPYLTHPVQLAANVAHLDELSGGRAVLGIGRGSMYHLVGQTSPASLGGLCEAIDVIRAVLSGAGEEYDGDVFRLGEGARLRFGTDRHVPVYLGALGPKGARLAGEHCEGLRMAAQWDPTYAGTIRPHLAAGERAAGRGPGEVDSSWRTGPTCTRTAISPAARRAAFSRPSCRISARCCRSTTCRPPRWKRPAPPCPTAPSSASPRSATEPSTCSWPPAT
jgi:5,10-methylenetetrahydromethanopterin reductase